MNNQLNIFERIVEDLMRVVPFSNFKFRKRDSSICDIKKNRSLYVELRHWTDPYEGILYIDPTYCVRYNILKKWLEPFSMKSIQTQRDNSSYFMYDKDLFNWPDAFEFKTNGDDYATSFQALYFDMIGKVSFYFPKYDTLQSCYDTEILPVLKGEKVLPENGSDWIFEDLALCKLVSPDSYSEFKKIVMKQVDTLRSKGEPNVLDYSKERMDEIIHYLEITDIANPKSLKANMAFIQPSERPDTKKKEKPPMPYKEYEKMQTDVRRSIAHKYGFRQNSYLNFKVEDGYFFGVLILAQAILEVKPMYADDLWWDIFDMPSNKKEPVSLRGAGCFSVDALTLSKFDIPESYDRRELEAQYEKLFQDITSAISKFLAKNPDADHFYPDEQTLNQDPYDLLNILALIHNSRMTEAMATAKKALADGKGCGMSRDVNGKTIDGFEYVIDWCRHRITEQQ